MMMNEIQTRAMAFLVALIILIVGGIAGYLIGDLWLGLSIEIALLVAIFLLAPILKPRPRHFRTRIAALSIFGGIALVIVRGDSWIVLLLNFIARQFDLSPIQPIEPPHQIILLAISGIVICILTWLFERQQTILPPEPPIPAQDEKLFQEPSYKELRNRFCKFMKGYLDRLDEESNWSDSDYTTLEAEVEMTRQPGKRSRVVADLIKALRNDKESQSFLLIGDPGSGKSVSLRRLARQLYEEVLRGDRKIVPLYVNLKEWTGSREPTDEDITRFVYRYLQRISGRAGQKFLKNYYEKMLSNGLFFFLFDSFDEMPMVLDCDDRSRQLKEISQAFDTFFQDLHKCRGILSSRPFRRPIGFRDRKLEIRPFQEKQIRAAMKKWLLGEGLDSDSMVRRLLKERPHLAPALRNPFMSDLIAQYIIHYRDRLPDTYYDLFTHYIDRRFDEDVSNLDELNLSKEDVLATAVEIARIIYNTPDTGLEISVSDLKNEIADPQLENKIKAMQYSRIVRWGGTNREPFSFVHRRFAEFFAVCALLNNPEMVKRDAIPTDSRWRDGLVVYCGIAPDSEVRELAEFAWQTIKENLHALSEGNIREARSAIHCLRFLRDACQSCPESIESFQEELSEVIVNLIEGKDLLAAKIATEALPIVTPHARTRGITQAFKRGVPWLSETALRSCRHLAELEPQVVTLIRRYIQDRSTLALLKSFNDLDFSLSLSDSLKPIQLIHRVDIFSLLILWMSFVIFILWMSFVIFSDFLYIGYFIFGIFLVEVFLKFCINHFLWILKQTAILIYDYRFSQNIFIPPLIFRSGFDSVIRLFFLMIFFYVIDSPIFYINRLWIALLIFIIVPGTFWYFVMYFFAHFKSSIAWIFSKLKSILSFAISLLFLYGFFVFFSFLFVLSFFALAETLFPGTVVFFGGLTMLILTVIPFGFLISRLIQNFLKIIQDYRLLKKLNLRNDIAWSTVYKTTKKFQSDWGQACYLEMLRIQKIQITDLDATSPSFSLRGLNAEEKMAQLKEQIYNLQE
ncbi:MAG: NACHT domain-containing NTPase [Spirulina sp.]